MRGMGPLIVNVAPMADLQDKHRHAMTLDQTDQPVVADPVPSGAFDG
jgi:hypothetical protein